MHLHLPRQSIAYAQPVHIVTRSELIALKANAIDWMASLRLTTVLIGTEESIPSANLLQQSVDMLPDKRHWHMAHHRFERDMACF